MATLVDDDGSARADATEKAEAIHAELEAGLGAHRASPSLGVLAQRASHDD